MYTYYILVSSKINLISNLNFKLSDPQSPCGVSGEVICLLGCSLVYLSNGNKREEENKI